jgi:H+/Cl- antiporter ClcA
VCLGSLRGGAIFPAVFLGGAAGVLLAPLPGYGLTPAMAGCMAATTTAAMELPLSCVVLVTLLVGHSGAIPVIMLSAAVATVTTHLLPVIPKPRPARSGPAPA